MRACALVFCFLSALTAAAQTKHPFTFEDMMKLKRVEEPAVSPNGKWVLFAAVDVDLKANRKTPHVWVVPLHSSSENTRVPHPTAMFGRVGGKPVLARAGYSEKRKAGSSTPSDHSQANDPTALGMTAGESGKDSMNREREIISDQDADRPRWAPDGQRFAFLSTKENGSQVWIANFDEATGTVTSKHRLTNIATEADGEVWSPDGKNVLFKSDVWPECDGVPEKEADCNARMAEDAKNSKVKALVFTYLLYRHWDAYREGKKTHLFVVPVDVVGNGRVGAGDSPVQSSEARQASQEVKDPTLSQNRGQGWGTLENVARDLTPGDYDAPVFSLGGQDDYAFSPDAQEICYASNHDPEPAISTNNDLFTVPVNFPIDATPAQVLAATKDITAENKAADNTPLYSPDGKYIAYRAQQRPGYESDRWRLMLYDRRTGERKNLTAEFDDWVGTYTWAGPRLFFVSEVTGSARIYYSDLGFVKPGAVATSLHGYDDDLAIGGVYLVYTRMSITAPSEIYQSPVAVALTPHCGESAGDVCMTQDPNFRLTHINDSVLSGISMSPLEPFWFTGADNDKVEGFLIKPPNFDPNKKYPLKFIVHGGPQVPMGDEWSYRWNSELFAANGYVVIFINFHASPGYGQKFIDAVNADWGGAPYEDLIKGLDYAEQHYPFIDKDRECALGASFGGYMINWIMGHTNRFKCLVTHDGDFNLEADYGSTEELWFPEWELKGTPWTNREMYRKWSPHLFVQNFKTPTLVVHGQLDYRIDVSEGLSLFTTLQRLGVPSKMLYFPDEGHWVLKPQNSQLWYKTVNDWVDQWIGKPVTSGQ